MSKILEIVQEISETTGWPESRIITLIGVEAMPPPEDLTESLNLFKSAKSSESKEYVKGFVDKFCKEKIDETILIKEIAAILLKIKDFSHLGLECYEILEYGVEKICRIFRDDINHSDTFTALSSIRQDVYDLRYRLQILRNSDHENLMTLISLRISETTSNVDELMIGRKMSDFNKSIDLKLFLVFKKELAGELTKQQLKDIANKTSGIPILKPIHLDSMLRFELDCFSDIKNAKVVNDLIPIFDLIKDRSDMRRGLFGVLVINWIKLATKLQEVEPLRDYLLENLHELDSYTKELYENLIKIKLSSDVEPNEIEYTRSFCHKDSRRLYKYATDKLVDYYRVIVNKIDDEKELREFDVHGVREVHSIVQERQEYLQSQKKDDYRHKVDRTKTVAEIQEVQVNGSGFEYNRIRDKRREQIYQSDFNKATDKKDLYHIFKNCGDGCSELKEQIVLEIFRRETMS